MVRTESEGTAKERLCMTLHPSRFVIICMLKSATSLLKRDSANRLVLPGVLVLISFHSEDFEALGDLT
jgi:hypothetical protein